MSYFEVVNSKEKYEIMWPRAMLAYVTVNSIVFLKTDGIPAKYSRKNISHVLEQYHSELFMRLHLKASLLPITQNIICFQIYFAISYRRENQRQYELKSATEADCKMWIDAIREAR